MKLASIVIAVRFGLRLRRRAQWRREYMALATQMVSDIGPQGMQRALIHLTVLHATQPYRSVYAQADRDMRAQLGDSDDDDDMSDVD